VSSRPEPQPKALRSQRAKSLRPSCWTWGCRTGTGKHSFGMNELLARIRAALRRSATAAGAGAAVVEFGDIRVDHVRPLVERAGTPVHLTPIEYRLLSLLIANSGKVLTHHHMLKAVWGVAAAEANPFLRVHVGNLRRKLERDPARPRHIVTETGVGYRFVP
jgi:two-component system KDP operon response regulator KdpE